MTGVTSSSLTSLSFVTIKRGLVGGLDCLPDLFLLTCDGPFRHSNESELLEGLDVSFNEILITDGRVSLTNWCLLLFLGHGDIWQTGVD